MQVHTFNQQLLMVTLHSRASGSDPVDQTNESIIRIMINQIVILY